MRWSIGKRVIRSKSKTNILFPHYHEVCWGSTEGIAVNSGGNYMKGRRHGQKKYRLSPCESEGEGHREHCPVNFTFKWYFQSDPSLLCSATSRIPAAAFPCSHRCSSPYLVFLLSLLPLSQLFSTGQPRRSFTNINQISALPCLEPFNNVLIFRGWNLAQIPWTPRPYTELKLLSSFHPAFRKFSPCSSHFYWTACCQFPEPAIPSCLLLLGNTCAVLSTWNTATSFSSGWLLFL